MSRPMAYKLVNSPWPEREGLRCFIVPTPHGPEADVYPWPGKGRDEAVIYIPDDPLDSATVDPRDWSCVVKYRSLIPWDGR